MNWLDESTYIPFSRMEVDGLMLSGPPRYIGTDRHAPRGRVYCAPQFVVWHPATPERDVKMMLGGVAARNVADAYRPDGVP